MVINSGGTVVNLREKLQLADRKKTQSDAGRVQKSTTSDTSQTSAKQYVTDIIGVRNENRLAVASSGSLMSNEEAFDTLDELKKQFSDDSSNAMEAHTKTDANTVMQFYPFEL